MEHRRETEYMLKVFKGASLRSIEDWCLNRIRSITGFSNTTTTHQQLVDYFLANYIPLGIQTEYILSLKRSEERIHASDVIHLQCTDEDKKIMWNALQPRLTNDDVYKYRDLMAFGSGDTLVKYKGGN